MNIVLYDSKLRPRSSLCRANTSALEGGMHCTTVIPSAGLSWGTGVQSCHGFFLAQTQSIEQCQHHAECQCFLIGFMMFYVLPNLQKNSLLWSWMDFFSFNLNRFWSTLKDLRPLLAEPRRQWPAAFSARKGYVPMMAEIGAPGNQWTVSKTSKTQESIPHYSVPIAVTGLIMVGNRNGHVLR